MLGSWLILWGSSQLAISHLWAVLLALTILLFNLLPTSAEFMRYTRFLSASLWPVKPVTPIASIPAAQPLGHMYVPLARWLSPDSCDRLLRSYDEWDLAISPSPLRPVLLFAPVHVWSLSPLYPHVVPLAQCPLMHSVKIDQLSAQYADCRPLLINRCQCTPTIVGFLEASSLDRLNFDIPAMLRSCPSLPCVSRNNMREPLRGDLLALKLLLKMKVGSQPTKRP
jgi:hypothetical protein